MSNGSSVRMTHSALGSVYTVVECLIIGGGGDADCHRQSVILRRSLIGIDVGMIIGLYMKRHVAAYG